MDLNANRDLITAALARIPKGDRAALQTVYRLTAAKLFGVCLRILGERSEAEDVLQEVYVTVWRKAANFDATRASPMTWLIAIARNRAIDRLRATRQSRRMQPIEAASDVADGAAPADRALETCTRPGAALRLPGNAVERKKRPLYAAHFSTAIPTRSWRRACASRSAP